MFNSSAAHFPVAIFPDLGKIKKVSYKIVSYFSRPFLFIVRGVCEKNFSGLRALELGIRDISSVSSGLSIISYSRKALTVSE